MDKLRTIISCFSPEEQKEFSLFIQRQKKKSSRKDLSLFQLLAVSPPKDSTEIVAKLYPGQSDRSPYHALRKRLMQHLISFVLLKRMEDDPTTASSVMGMLSMARYLFEKREKRLGWQFLQKARKQAIVYEHYDLLNSIYILQIEQSPHEMAPPMEDILTDYQKNKSLADEEERASIAYALIRQELASVRQKGKDVNFDETIRRILSEWQLTEAVSMRPKLFFQLMMIARSAVLAKRDFFHFEPFIVQQFERMEANQAFQPHHQTYRLEFLYTISH
ncbi:MAG: hypothetical protein AAF206_22540, partial [Bacteroidota bacterium]